MNVLVDKIGYLDDVTVSVVLEDTLQFDTPYIAKFGLSLLLELRSGEIKKDILFDTNSDAYPIISNLKILGKTLNLVSTIFLSHCHYDHTDGLLGILNAINRPLPIIGHTSLFRLCLEINPDGIRSIGMLPGTR